MRLQNDAVSRALCVVACAATAVSAGCYERGGIVTNADAIKIGRTTLFASTHGPFARYEYPGDEGNSGTLDYRHFDPSAFSIVGAGTDSTTRRIHLWDDVTVSGKTYLSNTAVSISAGPGIPTNKAQSGSIYVRVDGRDGQRLYVSAGNGVWRAVKGV